MVTNASKQRNSRGKGTGNRRGRMVDGRLIIKKGVFLVFLPISLIFLAHSNINSAVSWLPLETKLSKST